MYLKTYQESQTGSKTFYITNFNFRTYLCTQYRVGNWSFQCPHIWGDSSSSPSCTIRHNIWSDRNLISPVQNTWLWLISNFYIKLFTICRWSLFFNEWYRNYELYFTLWWSTSSSIKTSWSSLNVFQWGQCYSPYFTFGIMGQTRRRQWNQYVQFRSTHEPNI